MSERSDSDLPLGRPAPDAPVAALLALPKVNFYFEPPTREANPGFARGSMPVADVSIAARAVEWLMRLYFELKAVVQTDVSFYIVRFRLKKMLSTKKDDLQALF